MAEMPLIESPDTKRKDRLPPGQRLVSKLPVLHEGRAPELAFEQWTLRLFGLVDRERTLTHGEFLELPRARLHADLHCVTGWSRLDNRFEGVPGRELKPLIAIAEQARAVMVHCAGGYTANLLLEDFFAEDVMFALIMNGEPVPAAHGHPVRLIAPRLYLWKSAKWVNGIEFMDQDRPGFWESRGYHLRGDPWQEERYSGR